MSAKWRSWVRNSPTIFIFCSSAAAASACLSSAPHSHSHSHSHAAGCLWRKSQRCSSSSLAVSAQLPSLHHTLTCRIGRLLVAPLLPLLPPHPWLHTHDRSTAQHVTNRLSSLPIPSYHTITFIPQSWFFDEFFFVRSFLSEFLDLGRGRKFKSVMFSVEIKRTIRDMLWGRGIKVGRCHVCVCECFSLLLLLLCSSENWLSVAVIMVCSESERLQWREFFITIWSVSIEGRMQTQNTQMDDTIDESSMHELCQLQALALRCE